MSRTKLNLVNYKNINRDKYRVLRAPEIIECKYTVRSKSP